MNGVLVFGATGFLGGHLLEQLAVQPRFGQVTCVARTVPHAQADTSISWVPLQSVSASVEELTALLAAIQPTSVVNCIGLIGGDERELYDVNVNFVRKLTQALARHGRSSFVHLGSAAEYGLQPTGVPITEDADTRPVAAYGQTKLAATEIVSAAIDVGSVAGTILRIFNPLGDRSPVNSIAGKVASALQRALTSGDQVIDVGDLGDFRDFVDVRDVARAIGLAIVADGTGSRILNVGGGQAVQVRTLVSQLATIAGYTGVFRETLRPPSTSVVGWQQSDILRISVELGWAPRHSLDDALCALWESLPQSGRSVAESSLQR
jgi:nucleoside-diphosphate-sugar epimerase